MFLNQYERSSELKKIAPEYRLNLTLAFFYMLFRKFCFNFGGFAYIFVDMVEIRSTTFL